MTPDIKLGPVPTKVYRAKRVATRIGRGFALTGRAINKSSKAIGSGVVATRQGYQKAESKYLELREREAERKLTLERKKFSIRAKESQARNLKKKRKGPGKSYNYSPFG